MGFIEEPWLNESEQREEVKVVAKLISSCATNALFSFSSFVINDCYLNPN